MLFNQQGIALINLSFLPTGIYTMQIMLDDELITKKIMKTAE
jgi:hypothetical protein